MGGRAHSAGDRHTQSQTLFHTKRTITAAALHGDGKGARLWEIARAGEDEAADRVRKPAQRAECQQSSAVTNVGTHPESRSAPLASVLTTTVAEGIAAGPGLHRMTVRPDACDFQTDIGVLLSCAGAPRPREAAKACDRRQFSRGSAMRGGKHAEPRRLGRAVNTSESLRGCSWFVKRRMATVCAVPFLTPLTRNSCVRITTEFIKYVLFARQQLPWSDAARGGGQSCCHWDF